MKFYLFQILTCLLSRKLNLHYYWAFPTLVFNVVVKEFWAFLGLENWGGAGSLTRESLYPQYPHFGFLCYVPLLLSPRTHNTKHLGMPSLPSSFLLVVGLESETSLATPTCFGVHHLPSGQTLSHLLFPLKISLLCELETPKLLYSPFLSRQKTTLRNIIKHLDLEERKKSNTTIRFFFFS